MTDELAIPLDQIKKFRQLDSKCPGHPEYALTTGVETTTGPLGQGVAQQRRHGDRRKMAGGSVQPAGFRAYSTSDVYALCGDGCMMEGISSEAASLAGHLKLSNLCWIYDSNRITIEGNTDLASTRMSPTRFEAYGWNVMHVSDANDIEQFDRAFARSRPPKANRP